MALTLGKKKPAPAPTAEDDDAVETVQQPVKTKQESQPSASVAKKAGSVLKRGKEAQETLAKEEFKAESASKNQNLRFFMKDGGETSLTFLDGDLDSDGMLDIPYYFEHNMTIGGKYGNFFACIGESEPCPVCEGGNSSAYVGLLTVIDHSSYVSKKDGKTYKDQIRLFAAKRGTIKILQKIAEKRGGLTGARFDVSRTGAQSAAVGSMFDFTDKLTPEQITAKFGQNAKPLDYEEIIGSITYTSDELRKLGFGSLKGPVGSEAGPSDGGSDQDYSDKL